MFIRSYTIIRHAKIRFQVPLKEEYDIFTSAKSSFADAFLTLLIKCDFCSLMSRVSPVKCDGRDQPQTYCRKSDINQIIPYLTTLEKPERSEHIWYANGLQLMRSRHQRTPMMYRSRLVVVDSVHRCCSSFFGQSKKFHFLNF